MEEHGKTKEQLIHEMVEMRHRLATLGETDTGRKKAEEELERLSRQHQLILNSAGEGIYGLDLEGRTTFCNPAAARMIGWEVEELLGKPQHNILHHSRPDGSPYPREECPIYAAFNDGEVHHVNDEVFWRKDGTSFPVEYTSTPIRDERGELVGAVVTYRDITERKKAEEALRTSEERYRTLAEPSPDCIKLLDLEGTIIECNTVAVQCFEQKSKEDFIGKKLIPFFPEEYQPDLLEALDGVRQGQETRLQLQTHASTGALMYWDITINPIRDEADQVISILFAGRDITERVQAEEELRERHEELKKSYDALERAQTLAISAEKLAALGRLTAGVSHEVLNPLSIITLSLQLMIEDRETPTEIARQLRILDEQADRIVKIAQDLLYFARQRKPERLWLDFNETLQRTLGLLARDLHLQNIAVELTLSEGLPPLLADQGQLQQVVLNLLTNARDAMPKGGRLSLSTKSVQTNGKKFVELRVEDTGEGIAPEHLENLFDPFFTTKPVGEGTGLGLSICQGIVEAHGGSIWAEVLPEGGAAFVVRLGMEEG